MYETPFIGIAALSFLWNCVGNMADQTHTIGVPEPLAQRLQDTVDAARDTVKRKLGYDGSVDVVVFESRPEFVIPELGITGMAVGAQGIEILVDLSRSYEENELENEVMSTTHHETTHIVHENLIGTQSTLLYRMLAEGIGCYVEQYFRPERYIPYIQPVENERSYIREAEPLLDTAEYDHATWFFGAGELPRWIGYRLGYLIVSDFMEHTGTSLHDLVRTDIHDILKGSRVLEQQE